MAGMGKRKRKAVPNWSDPACATPIKDLSDSLKAAAVSAFNQANWLSFKPKPLLTADEQALLDTAAAWATERVSAAHRNKNRPHPN